MSTTRRISACGVWARSLERVHPRRGPREGHLLRGHLRHPALGNTDFPALQVLAEPELRSREVGVGVVATKTVPPPTGTDIRAHSDLGVHRQARCRRDPQRHGSGERPPQPAPFASDRIRARERSRCGGGKAPGITEVDLRDVDWDALEVRRDPELRRDLSSAGPRHTDDESDRHRDRDETEVDVRTRDQSQFGRSR